MQLHIEQNGQNRSPRSPQDRARTVYAWALSTDRLLFHLTYGRNRHSQRFLRSDLEYLRAWLQQPDLPSALATLFGNGHDEAVALVLRHRDYMLHVGKSVATVNRHLCTIRAAARIAREMGQIGWDLADVPQAYVTDNAMAVSEVEVVDAGADGQESSRMVEMATSAVA